MTNLAHQASFHSRERIAPSNRGTKHLAEVSITAELRDVVSRTPDIAPAFILNHWGKPYKPERRGNLFRDATGEVGMIAR